MSGEVRKAWNMRLWPASPAAVLAVAATCVLILVLFHGFKDLAGLPPGLATLAVPITLLLSAYMGKIILAADVNRRD
jgi:hypothetical protein